MQKVKLAKNTVRLILVILLMAMIFLPTMKLKMNHLSDTSAEYIVATADRALSNGHITQEEYDAIAKPIDSAEKILTSNEEGAIENRYEYSQSFFSMLLSIPDAVTLIGGDFTKEVDYDKVSSAVNDNSVQTFVLIKNILLNFNVKEIESETKHISPPRFSIHILSAYFITLAIFLVYALIITPLKYFFMGIKELKDFFKNKKAWLEADIKAEDEFVASKLPKLMIPLLTMLITPLILRGSGFTAYYVICVVLLLLVVVLSALIPSEKKQCKNLRRYITVSAAFFALTAVVSVFLLNVFMKYDVFKYVIENEDVMKWLTENSINSSQGTVNVAAFVNSIYLIRFFAIMCALAAIRYMKNVLLRLASVNRATAPDASAMYTRFIFFGILITLYQFMMHFNRDSFGCIIVCAIAFASEMAFAFYRDNMDKKIEDEAKIEHPNKPDAGEAEEEVQEEAQEEGVFDKLLEELIAEESEEESEEKPTAVE